MSELRGYVLSVISVAVLAAIVKRFMGEKGTTAAIGKLMTGLVLTFAVISPVLDLNISDMSGFFDAYTIDAQQVVQEGVEISSDSFSKRIKEKTEAYILYKAKQYDAVLTVDVTLTTDAVPTPKSISIRGNISPYAKNALQNMIATDLGISKENQQWT